MHAVPAHYYASVEDAADEYDARFRQPDPTDPETACSPHEPFDDWYNANFGGGSASGFADAAGAGTQNSPFDLDPEEDATASSRNAETPPSPPPSDFVRDEIAGNQATPQKRRLDPRGILLGTWKVRSPHAVGANAVFVSRDRLGRINRRLSKQTVAGTNANNPAFNARRTACKHEMINHTARWQGMTKAEVDSHVMPLLRVAAGLHPTDTSHDLPETPSRRASTARSRAAAKSPLGAIPSKLYHHDEDDGAV